jgi:5-hydroxyisourate hydrolase
MGRLTTHVLDTAQGKPGKNIEVRLFSVNENGRTSLLTITTNADGRCDQPLLEGDALKAGVYELDFHLGNYFKAMGVAQSQPPFLDVVTLRFGVADPAAHYHVPLVATPYSYSTYRGS